MKKIILTIIFIISVTLLFAQNKGDTTNTRPENNFSLNLAGEGSFISINFERLFFINSDRFLAGINLKLHQNETSRYSFHSCIFI